MKIFIMDDERHICTYLTDLFDLEGHVTITASSVREAGVLINKEKFDLALVDFRIIDGIGTEVVRLLKTRRPEVKVIGMSGSEQSETFFTAGADSFIEKPFTEKQILRVISEIQED